MRKGVVDLADAIPLILGACPQAKFRFVERPLPSPKMGVDIKTFLMQNLAREGRVVEFWEPVEPAEVPAPLAETDVCAFPGLWESFGYTCLESLAAGRGMDEMLQGDDREYGLLVPPQSPEKIASAVITLLTDPARRREYGAAGRKRVVEH